MADFSNIPVGTFFEFSQLVTSNDTAKKYGSGMVDVFATPAMIALMEKTCMDAVAPFLPIGYGTVGVAVNVVHGKATPIGQKVNCIAKVVGVDGRKIFYEVVVSDENDEIGKGTHTRFIVDLDKFMEKTVK
jgi:Predicted thioesterase